MRGTYTAGFAAPLQKTQGDMRLTHGVGRGMIWAMQTMPDRNLR
jgi:hypothetical protein